MTDPNESGQPTQEELEAHLAQLREADVSEIVVQTVNMLATGAQVKLGRSDARVLIDVLVALADTVDGHVEADLVRQIRDAVGQLQMAQVQAEREAGSEAGQPAAGGAGAQAPSAPQGGPAAGRPQAQQQGGEEGSLTDRLWIPGREPGQG